MKRTRSKKLSLNRETVVRLESSVMERARGGAEALFGTAFLCGSKRCGGSEWTCKAGTCGSCDGPLSCEEVCIGGEELPQ